MMEGRKPWRPSRALPVAEKPALVAGFFFGDVPRAWGVGRRGRAVRVAMQCSGFRTGPRQMFEIPNEVRGVGTDDAR